MRKAFLLAALAAFAAHGAKVKVATRDWVESRLGSAGVYLAPIASVKTNVVWSGGVATTNYSFRSAFEDPDNPRFTEIILTFSFGSTNRQTRFAATRRSPSIFSLLVRSAYADIAMGKYFSAYLLDFTLVDSLGGTVDTGFAEKQEFVYQTPLPMSPPDTEHVCDIDPETCLCSGANITSPEDIEYPEEYRRIQTSEQSISQKGNILLWYDLDNWPYTVVTKKDGSKKYMIPTGDGKSSVALDVIGQTDAWKAAVNEAFDDMNKYLEECRLAYAASLICIKDNPQHDWGEWSATGNYWYDTEETIRHCNRNGAHFEKGSRPHNHDGHWGAWQYQDVNGVSVKIRYCQLCGKEDGPHQVDSGPLTCSGDSHIPLSMVATNGANRCGCVCGEVDPENFKEEQYHLFVAGSQTPCLCQCGHYHRGVAPSAYDVNREVACQNICTHCNLRRHNSNGIDVPAAGAEDHQPRTSGHCGCRCGKYTHSDHDPECAKFHIRKAGDCCCLGADGSGGDWHFPCAKSGCTKICEYNYNRFGPHLAVTRKVNTEEHPLVTAESKDHTRNDASCGCKCGDMSSSNISDWNSIEDLHKWASGHCVCVCGKSPKHRGISLPPCDDICRGYEAKHQRSSEYKQCPLTVSGVRIGSNIKYSHTPRADGCGCACNDFKAGDYDGDNDYAAAFHNGTGSPACWCSCGKNGQNAWHTFVTNNPCYKICNECKATTSRSKTFRTKVVAVNPAKDHTAVTNRCGCECRNENSKNYKKYHPILDGHCGCVECNRNNYREHWYIDHVTEDNETGNGPSYTCGICGNTIGRIRHTVTCKTNPDGCWLCPYTYYVESGHADGCGALPRDPSEDDEADDTPIFGPPDDKPPATCTAVTFDGNVCGHKLNEDGSCPNEVNHNSSGSIDETGTSDTGEPGGNSGNNGGGTIDPLNF